jgi:hypothetical protein
MDMVYSPADTVTIGPFRFADAMFQVFMELGLDEAGEHGNIILGPPDNMQENFGVNVLGHGIVLRLKPWFKKPVETGYIKIKKINAPRVSPALKHGPNSPCGERPVNRPATKTKSIYGRHPYPR